MGGIGSGRNSKGYKKAHLSMHPATVRELKIMGDILGLTLGDVITYLVSIRDMGNPLRPSDRIKLLRDENLIK